MSAACLMASSAFQEITSICSIPFTPFLNLN
jgi:hypothetical protein